MRRRSQELPQGRVSWWRRNAVALIALAVLLPVTFGVIGIREWWAIYEARPVWAQSVEPGGVFGGAEWGEATFEAIPQWESDSVPEGAQSVLVTIPMQPVDEPIECRSPVLRETSGEKRTWDYTNSAVDLPGTMQLETRCSGSSSGRVELLVPFIIPADAEGPFFVEIVISEELPRFLRFEVEL